MYARTKRRYVLEPNTFVLTYPNVFLRVSFADDDDNDDNDLCLHVVTTALLYLVPLLWLISSCPHPTHSSFNLGRNVGGQHPLLHGVKAQKAKIGVMICVLLHSYSL